MKHWTFAGSVTLAIMLTFHASAAAQDVGLAGTITDATEAVLPGTTVTAVHVESGNSFVATSDVTGQYRIVGMRPGVYRITAELAGFNPVTQENVELLVGQRATVNLKLALSTVQETVTVTGDAPLIDLTQSNLGGNIDARQMQELPLNGRNWLDLTMLTPGSRTNAVTESPFGTTSDTFQLNVDGQQVTNTIAQASFGQPKFSRDAIAEFEFVTSRFDATQGRSSGVQVNAVTKSGTNVFSGSTSGYFRDDSFNAKDFIVNRVLPYSDQQVSATVGGPLKRDRAHFFGYFEGEREPRSFTYTSQFPRFNIPDLTAARTEEKAGARFDVQINAATRFMARANGWIHHQPYEPATTGGATIHPSRAGEFKQRSGQLYGTLTQTIGARKLNEVRAGLATIRTEQLGRTQTPEIRLQGYTIGKVWFYPLTLNQKTYSIREDFTYISGRQELKVGGEFLYPDTAFYWPSHASGTIDALGGPPPANIEALFPVWDDLSTWNLAALSPITRVYRIGFGDFYVKHPQPEFAAWIQDNWTMARGLTLNLGLRYDYYHDALANSVDLPPFRRPAANDKLNFAPRLGFAYTRPGNRTVLRGGFGKYFAGVRDQWTHHTAYHTQVAVPEIRNDGRPNFTADPFNVTGGGHVPTFEEALRFRRDSPGGSVTADNAHTPYSYQSSIGLQRQLGRTMAVQADYVWAGGRRQENSRPANLAYNPAIGTNYPFSDLSKRPFPEWGYLTMRFADGRSNYHGLETGFTRRMSNHWQLSATYTLSGTWDDNPLPLMPGCEYPLSAPGVCNVPMTLAPDLGGEYTLAAGDQRHRAVVNGIWELPYGLQVSGLYFYGSGQRYGTSYGADLRNTGGTSGRLRPNGTIIPRNNFVGRPLHRVDLRALRRLRLQRVEVHGILEMFNVFNHENFGSYVLTEVSRTFLQPVQNTNVAYQPRMIQLGFRVTF